MIYLNFRNQPQNRKRYYIGVGLSAVWLSRINGDENTSLASNSISINYNEWHTIKVAGNGGNIKIYFDNVLIIDYTDLNPHLNGSMTLISEPYGHAHFDDVLVEEIK